MITHSCDICKKGIPSSELMVVLRTYPVIVYGNSSQPFSQKDVSPQDSREFDRQVYLCPKCMRGVWRQLMEKE